jgi:hypothetical protein
MKLNKQMDRGHADNGDVGLATRKFVQPSGRVKYYHDNLALYIIRKRAHDSVVVEALCYKPEGRGIASR